MKKIISDSLVFLFILATAIAAGNAQEAKPRGAQNTKAGNAQAIDPNGVTKSRYAVGQVWSYKTRPNETKSAFMVVRVESDPKLGNIIHIALRDLKIKNPHSPGGITDTMNHLPPAEEAIARSAVKLLEETVQLPDFEKSYRLWRDPLMQIEQMFTKSQLAKRSKLQKKA